jgi:hypothetical protein
MRNAFIMTCRGKTLCAATACLLALTGCDQIDPLKRPYMWHDSGVNAHNIAAMAANPADLIHGRDSPKRASFQDADGVDRLLTGHPAVLPGGLPPAAGGSGGAAAGGGSAPPAAGGT